MQRVGACKPKKHTVDRMSGFVLWVTGFICFVLAVPRSNGASLQQNRLPCRTLAARIRHRWSLPVSSRLRSGNAAGPSGRGANMQWLLEQSFAHIGKVRNQPESNTDLGNRPLKLVDRSYAAKNVEEARWSCELASLAALRLASERFANIQRILKEEGLTGFPDFRNEVENVLSDAHDTFFGSLMKNVASDYPEVVDEYKGKAMQYLGPVFEATFTSVAMELRKHQYVAFVRKVPLLSASPKGAKSDGSSASSKSRAVIEGTVKEYESKLKALVPRDLLRCNVDAFVDLFKRDLEAYTDLSDRVTDERLKVGKTHKSILNYIHMQQQQITSLQNQLKQADSGPPLSVSVGYRIPDTNVNLSGSYQQGRPSLQITCVPDESNHLLGSNGFVKGLTPGNIGLSVSFSV
eukprot:GHVU01192337.1.p1 GENE.GHVU01192337.1~~GHVU01192337.1.p1  ORF type:complete len:406 (-),score=33.95 GHVU01192337.1:1238-2455(-)